MRVFCLYFEIMGVIHWHLFGLIHVMLYSYAEMADTLIRRYNHFVQ